MSSDEQREHQPIENQGEFGQRYCQLHGLELVAAYRDDGVSGTIPLHERTEGRRLLGDACRKRFDVVLVYRLDRLARKTPLLLSICEQLEHMGIGVRSMTETFDTSTPAGRAMLGMLATFAGYERDSLVERTSLGRERALRLGRHTGGGVPFGYRLTADKRLEVEPQEAEVVKEVFRLYTQQRLSAEAIADYLTARSVPPRAFFQGAHRAVIRVLENPVYMGRRVWHYTGNEIVQEVPAIVDEATFRLAEQLRAKNRREAMRNSRRHYLLRGLIRCGLCGLSYVGQSANG